MVVLCGRHRGRNQGMRTRQRCQVGRTSAQSGWGAAWTRRRSITTTTTRTRVGRISSPLQERKRKIETGRKAGRRRRRGRKTETGKRAGRKRKTSGGESGRASTATPFGTQPPLTDTTSTEEETPTAANAAAPTMPAPTNTSSPPHPRLFPIHSLIHPSQ